MQKNKDTKRGRPEIIKKDVLAKLEQAFKIGATDVEACYYATINPATLYRYQDKNPEFCEKKEAWKKNPIMKAKRTIFQSRGILSSTPSDGCPLQEVRKYPAEAELLRRNELQLRRRNVGNESRTAGY